MTLKSDLDALAKSLLKEATGQDIETKVDIFKAVSAYHTASVRVGKGKDADGPPPTTFKDIIKQIGTQQ